MKKMTTQISFTVDNEIKKKAMMRAKKEWITLKAFLHYCMSAFANQELSLGIVSSKEQSYPHLEKVISDTEKKWYTAKSVEDLFNDILG